MPHIGMYHRASSVDHCLFWPVCFDLLHCVSHVLTSSLYTASEVEYQSSASQITRIHSSWYALGQATSWFVPGLLWPVEFTEPVTTHNFSPPKFGVCISHKSPKVASVIRRQKLRNLVAALHRDTLSSFICVKNLIMPDRRRSLFGVMITTWHNRYTDANHGWTL